MLTDEEAMEIKILFNQGKSLREISRLMKISRNTVRRYLRSEQKPNYKCRINRVSKLAPFYDYLQERVKVAKPDWIPAPVLYREIKALGYEGGIRILYKYLSGLRVKKEECVVRFETSPGHQMQVDWVVFRRGKDSLSAFVATLGYSRATFVEFVKNERLETLLACHTKAFEYLGGVPQEILYDNMKTVVIKRDSYGLHAHRFQRGFLDYAGHYGFIPRLCRPYRAQTKGKVERFNRYLRGSFFTPLSSCLKGQGLLVDVELANYEVKKWLRDIANQRVHGTTGLVPSAQLMKERAYLQSIPAEYPGKVMPCFPKKATHSFQHSLELYDQFLEVSL